MNELPEAAALSVSPEGIKQLQHLVNEFLGTLLPEQQRRRTVLTPGGQQVLAVEAAKALNGAILPAAGKGAEALWPLAAAFAAHATQLTDPRAVAHLQCAPLAVAAAAEMVVAMFNQSPDMWDCGPFAMEVEQRLMRELCALAGFEAGAGVMVPGGSIANLLALVLARDAVMLRKKNLDVAARGLPPDAGQPVVLCSEAAHFCVGRAGAITGIGEDNVIRVPVDNRDRMLPGEALRILRHLSARRQPVALIATAGTTDTGAIDPIAPLADICRTHGIWLHVDGAYGGPVIFSPRLKHLLHGLEAADSFSFNLHKFGWQPAATSVFLLRDGALHSTLGREVACLNPREDPGMDLMDRTLQGTRTADAFRVAATLQALGADGMADMIDRCHLLALHAARRIDEHPLLQLAAPVTLSTVLFRYQPDHPGNTDTLNRLQLTIRNQLLDSGRAHLGRTVRGRDRTVWLKLVFVNPHTTHSDVDQLLDTVVETAHATTC